jgi:hypothetical protein
MLIGAYRDNEVTAANPLLRSSSYQDGWRESGGNQAHAARTRASRRTDYDTLRCDQARRTARPIGARTDGNPSSSISSCPRSPRGMLIFDHDAARWSQDLDRIHAKGYTENVVELMVGSSPACRQVRAALRQLASLETAPTSTLSIGSGLQRVHAALWPADQELIEHLRARTSSSTIAFRRLLIRWSRVAWRNAPSDEQIARGAHPEKREE